MRRCRAFLGLSVLVVATWACKKPTANLPPEEISVAPPPLMSAAPPVPVCADQEEVPIAGDDDELLVGESAYKDGQLALGASLRHEGRKVHAVLLTPAAKLSAPKVVSLAPSVGDEPPPRVFADPSGVFALHYASAPKKRELALSRIDLGKGSATELARMTVPPGDSYAFDGAIVGARALVVFDEDRPVAGKLIGGIRARWVGAGLGAGASTAGSGAAAGTLISPESSDAESPRIVATGQGFFVLWLTRVPEPAVEAGLEGAGEDRTYAFVEMRHLGADGQADAPVLRLTSPKGHVVAFEALPSAAGLSVYVQDEGARGDGAGGHLQRVDVAGSAARPPMELLPSGLGHALFTLGRETGASSAESVVLGYADTAEAPRVALVSPTGAVSPRLLPEGPSRLLGAHQGSLFRMTFAADAGKGAPRLCRTRCP
jgi:hypothetical protein